MRDLDTGRVTLGLEEREGSWSLYANASAEALNELYVLKEGFLPADETIFGEAENPFRIEILGSNLKNKIGDERTKHDYMKFLVDYVGSLEKHLGEFDTENYKIIPHGRIHQLIVGSERFSDGRLCLGTEVRRPTIASDEQVSKIATVVMQSVARTLGYMADMEMIAGNRKRYTRFIRQNVGVNYNTDSGVTITTNPVGSCSIDTDGSTYKPDSETIELQQHNLYSYEQQLLCLVGAVAVADADTLVK